MFAPITVWMCIQIKNNINQFRIKFQYSRHKLILQAKLCMQVQREIQHKFNNTGLKKDKIQQKNSNGYQIQGIKLKAKYC